MWWIIYLIGSVITTFSAFAISAYKEEDQNFDELMTMLFFSFV